MNRRRFVGGAIGCLLAPSVLASDEKNRLRVAVIGHTGRGNYGHGLDTVWLRVPQTEIVGVADANPTGLAQGCQRLRIDVKHGFADYRKLLAATRPDLVAVCPRHPDQRVDMILAAVEAGARGLYVEKPFCRSPAEADAIVAACRQRDVKLAVAHRNRYHPALPAINRLLANDRIGRVLELRGRGKGDHRGGGEDLWVLGCHVMNLIHYFGGLPLSCSASMRQGGRPVASSDIRDGNESLGPLAGDEVHARYEMERGMVAYFDSVANDGTRNAGFGLQIIGSEGIIDIDCDRDPIAHLVPGNPFQPTDTTRRPLPISSAGIGKPEPIHNLHREISAHRVAIADLLDSLQQDRQPLCGVEEAAMTVEMICSVFASHLQGGRAVDIPLADRKNALAGSR